MKKIFSLIIAGVALLSAASCVHEQLAVFDPAKGTAPVLGTTTVDDKGVTAEFTPGSFDMGFNKSIPVNHSLAIVELDGAKISKTLSANASDGKISISKANLSKALIALGKPEGSTVSLKMAVRASMQNPAQDNGVNGYIDSKDLIDIPSWLVEIPEVQGNPWKDFATKSTWSVIGSIASTGNEWNKDEPMFSSPDGTQHVATRLKLATGDQFKVRNNGGWDDNRGAGGDVEPFVLALGEAIPAVGGGKNLAVPADGVYDLLYDSAAETITLTEAFMTYPGFDQASPWSVIGAIASFEMNWDKDIAMTTDGSWHVAEGVELKADDQFKFRKDQDWTDNFGAEGDVEPFVVTLDNEYPAAGGGKNLAVPADGVYDLLVNPDAKLFKVVESLGGKSGLVGGDEPGPGPEPEPVTGWNIIGLNGDWDNDVRASENNGVWSAIITAKEATEFKWRKDGGWDENYGGVMVAYGEPFAAVAGGDNIKLAEAGLFKVTLDLTDTANPKITVYKDFTVWALIGVNGDWDNDIDMTEDNGKWVSPATKIAGEFKLRKNHGWDDNRGGVLVNLGEAFAAVAGGDNIKVPEEAEYIVTYDPSAETIVVEAAIPSNTWSLIGVNGDWNNDIFMTELMPGVWVSPKVEITSPGWKIRFNHGWDVNRGGATPAEGQFVKAVPNGDNINLTGTFQVVYNANNESIGTLVWGVVGAIAAIPEFNWNKDVPMMLAPDGKWYSIPVTLAAGDQIKIRKYADWGENYGGDFGQANVAFSAVAGGNNIAAEGNYMVIFDPALGTLELSNEYWGLVGEFNEWGNKPDAFMVPLGDSKWVAYGQTIPGPWKVRQGSDWGNNRGGVFASMDALITAVPNGDNITVPAGAAFDVVYDAKNETIFVGDIAKMPADTPGPGPSGNAISTADDLLSWLANPTGDVELGADIDLTGKEIPAGLVTGTLDGKGHTVTYSLNVTERIPADYEGDKAQAPQANLGLIKGLSGTVKNLKTKGSITISPEAGSGTYHVGGIVAITAENAVIENCESAVNILADTKCTHHMGGIAGFASNGTKITGCKNTGSVKMVIPDHGAANASQLGGIVGHIEAGGEVSKCVNDGDLLYSGTGTPRMGGMCGYVNNVVDVAFIECTNNGEVQLDGPASGYCYFAGITGYYGTPTNSSKVVYRKCVNNGNISAVNTVAATSLRLGGILCHCGGTKMDTSKPIDLEVTDCSNSGNITTDCTSNKQHIGGVIAFTETVCCIIKCDGCSNTGNITIKGNGTIGSIHGYSCNPASTYTNFTTGKDVVLTTEGGKAGMLMGSGYVGEATNLSTNPTGKVLGGKIVNGETVTEITAENYKDNLIAAGFAGNFDGVTFGN